MVWRRVKRDSPSSEAFREIVGRVAAWIFWIISGDALHHETALMARYAPDLAKDRFQVWLSKYHYVPMVTVGLLLLAFGGWRWISAGAWVSSLPSAA